MRYISEGNLIKVPFGSHTLKTGISFSHVNGIDYYLPNKTIQSFDKRHEGKCLKTVEKIKRRWVDYFESLATMHNVDLNKNKIIYAFETTPHGTKMIFDVHRI